MFQKVGTQLVHADASKLPAAITSPEQAAKAAMFAAMAKEYIKEIDSRLKGWIKDNGPVPIPELGRVTTLDEVTNWKAPLGQVVGKMVELGVPKEAILDRMELSWGTVESFVKKCYPANVGKEEKIRNQSAREFVGGGIRPLGKESTYVKLTTKNAEFIEEG